MRKLVLIFISLLMTAITYGNDLYLFKELYLKSSSLVKKEFVYRISPESNIMYVHLLSGGDTGEGGGPQRNLIKTIESLYPDAEDIPESYMEVVVNLKDLPTISVENITLNSITAFYIKEDGKKIQVVADDIEFFYLDRNIEDDSSPVKLTELMGFKLYNGETYISSSLVEVKVKIMIVL